MFIIGNGVSATEWMASWSRAQLRPSCTDSCSTISQRFLDAAMLYEASQSLPEPPFLRGPRFMPFAASSTSAFPLGSFDSICFILSLILLPELPFTPSNPGRERIASRWAKQASMIARTISVCHQLGIANVRHAQQSTLRLWLCEVTFLGLQWRTWCGQQACCLMEGSGLVK